MSMELQQQDLLWETIATLQQRDHNAGEQFSDTLHTLYQGAVPEQYPVKIHVQGKGVLLRPQPQSNKDGTPTTLSDALRSANCDYADSCCVQGVTVEGSCTVEEAYEALCSPDQFLHLVVAPQPEE